VTLRSFMHPLNSPKNLNLKEDPQTDQKGSVTWEIVSSDLGVFPQTKIELEFNCCDGKLNIETHISMDLANNKAGRIAGKACHPNARNCCARACFSKLSAGGLVVAFPTGDPIPGLPGSITPPTLGDILDPQTNPGLPQIGQPK